MCTTCGCGHQEMSHEEMHRLGIAHGHGKTVDITVEQDILSENNRIAGQNRNIWNTTDCWAIHLVSSPGSGNQYTPWLSPRCPYGIVGVR